jgi:hypothetical protein
MLYEIKPEPVYVTHMSVCPLLDSFQKYLGISVLFGLMICTATANTTVGNENVLVEFLGERMGSILQKFVVPVILEKMKCSYVYV